ncbi:hypothetical protein GL218_01958 [Daldinia childiae]|uniref:uncharacterized protein n=1 Tax=Daldinia childiae TaxID=326645 RepID=UPI0014463D32|nr:uncharacterized protein GL218_01958 [Daldinia childiae]KAF3063943.1 hypothetical protein GL218_01958 [Daldinia childiae]
MHMRYQVLSTEALVNVVHNFENATNAIETSTNEFEREAKLAHDIVAAEHRKTVEDALPNLEICPKLPTRLFSVPFPRNSMFLGHDDNLSWILEKIQNATQSQNSCVIHGIGGVGKTQLALEFTYRFQEKFRYIFWLSADDEASLSGTFGRIATMLSLKGPDQGPSHLTIEVARRWLCENPPPAYTVTAASEALEKHQDLSLTTLEANIIAYGAGVLWNTGGITNRRRAHVMTWRVLELREQYIKNTPDDQLVVEDHVLLANAYNDWAVQLINEGKYAEAKPYSEKSLAMKEKLLDTKSHQFEFFISKIKLAFAILAEGCPEEGIAMAQDAITHIERERGAEDPYTIHHMFQVANAWANVGSYKKAAALHKAVMKARISLFGETNPDTLNVYFAVALCLYRIEEFSEAQQNLSQCFKNSEAAQWSVENILRAKYLHALIMQHMNEEAEGKALESEVIAERNDLLSKFAEGKWVKPLPCRNEFIYFDYLVNINAGRTSIGQLEID